jgi:serine/threonine protein kinase, bacterial
VSAFLSVAGIDQPPSAYVARHGRVEREFSRPTQDSGNLSWIVEAPEGRLFIKTAGTDAPPPPGAPTPYFVHSGRVRLLRNAIDLARSCDHPALAALLNVIEAPAGPMLVYQAAPGELIGGLSPALAPGQARADELVGVGAVGVGAVGVGARGAAGSAAGLAGDPQHAARLMDCGVPVDNFPG